MDTNEESLDSKTYTDNEQSARVCNDAGDDDADKDAMIKYKDSSKETRTYSRTQGFSVGAQLGSIKSNRLLYCVHNFSIFYFFIQIQIVV